MRAFAHKHPEWVPLICWLFIVSGACEVARNAADLSFRGFLPSGSRVWDYYVVRGSYGLLQIACGMAGFWRPNRLIFCAAVVAFGDVAARVMHQIMLWQVLSLGQSFSALRHMINFGLSMLSSAPWFVCLVFLILWRRRARDAEANPWPRCPTCGYILYKLTSDHCPECGTMVAVRPQIEPTEHESHT